jgi:hypothetical protein
VAVLALVDLAWAQAIGFRLVVVPRDFIMAAGASALWIVARRLGSERGALVMEFICLSLAGVVFEVFSYLAMGSAYGPLWDAPFLAADRALGFDWLALYNWVTAQTVLGFTLHVLYVSILVQAFIAGIVLGLRGEQQKMVELYRIVSIACLITCIGAMFFPALGPFKLFAVPDRGAYLPDMEHLLTHQNLTFRLSELTGVVTFPSFHVVVALAYAWGLRHAGRFGRVMVVLNLAMLPSIPVYGGHYLVDTIAGAAVMLVSLGIVKAIPVVARRLATSIQSAPVSASAGL